MFSSLGKTSHVANAEFPRWPMHLGNFYAILDLC